MIVISDTSPLTALLSVGAADILPQLFNEVVIPEAVRDELQRSHPQLPPWLRVAAVANLARAWQYGAHPPRELDQDKSPPVFLQNLPDKPKSGVASVIADFPHFLVAKSLGIG